MENSKFWIKMILVVCGCLNSQILLANNDVPIWERYYHLRNVYLKTKTFKDFEAMTYPDPNNPKSIYVTGENYYSALIDSVGPGATADARKIAEKFIDQGSSANRMYYYGQAGALAVAQQKPEVFRLLFEKSATQDPGSEQQFVCDAVTSFTRPSDENHTLEQLDTLMPFLVQHSQFLEGQCKLFSEQVALDKELMTRAPNFYQQLIAMKANANRRNSATATAAVKSADLSNCSEAQVRSYVKYAKSEVDLGSKNEYAIGNRNESCALIGILKKSGAGYEMTYIGRSGQGSPKITFVSLDEAVSKIMPYHAVPASAGSKTGSSASILSTSAAK